MQTEYSRFQPAAEWKSGPLLQGTRLKWLVATKYVGAIFHKAFPSRLPFVIHLELDVRRRMPRYPSVGEPFCHSPEPQARRGRRTPQDGYEPTWGLYFSLRLWISSPATFVVSPMEPSPKLEYRQLSILVPSNHSCLCETT